ncbi:head completion/stabilization protein [Novosphingobium humi]|uniref:Head completion/stabilization protein n=1 Tax=Novosphingobium humi TaxID=2282397 RepID=A0ABY7TWU1_9SPHN|nr:head completion/stabilization protein [Novosphingobium humi]WCT76284.1 head completion/stabilization protein [Novosphingobium humi]WJS97255.1 head completion/stabilization protein [Novosphingobium humi]
MSSFTPTPMAPPDDPDAQVVADGWFPPVRLEEVREGLNIGGGAITQLQLTLAIEGGMLTAMRQLAAWRSARALAGAASLADVTTDTLNEKNRATLLWTRAVGYYAAADIAAGNRDLASSDTGLARASEKAALADEYRREGHAAIADLLSISGPAVARNRVEML